MEGFPEEPRLMRSEEGEKYFQSMLEQIRAFDPKEIIAVSRSGFSYAMWVAQELRLPLGVYWPSTSVLVADNLERIVFVDDNVVNGETFSATKLMMALESPETEWRWAVLFTDWNTPKEIRDEVIHGVRLPYFAEEPMWGSRKVSKGYGVRFRDEDSI